MDVELGESGGEVYRVTREEISVDAVQRVANLHTIKNVTFPSLKKYLWCRMKEPSAVSAPGYTLADGRALVPVGSITWELVCLT